MGHLERRITHQDIDAAEFSSGSINHRATVSRIGQVTTHEYASATSVLNQTGDLSSVLVLIEYAINTSARSRAYATATARPIPLSPPVITARLPVSRPEPR